MANIVLKVSPAYGNWCDVLKLASLRDVAGEDKRNKPHHFLYIKVGRKMKIINENLEMIDFEDKKEEIEEAKTSATLGYKMMAKMTLMDLVYDMNRNTCHKMNFMIIGAQLVILTISFICQFLFDEFKNHKKKKILCLHIQRTV